MDRIKAFEMYIQAKMERTKWVDIVSKEEILIRINENKIFNTNLKRKENSTEHGMTGKGTVLKGTEKEEGKENGVA